VERRVYGKEEDEMNEILEIIYHCHKGNSIEGIKRSLGFDSKTIG